ncbi:hypothetical protein CTAYLR_006078 [Chrysophaeum taylorii]|uniref:Uncharacterized protein n=1 Tax=Chrysophaeum taylorii TaxID=2483200 RepID=A0AAD7XPN6_9STRA|nr:hypothetical protein CTAYLR_006078 [Chrysophaeum taylorii]
MVFALLLSFVALGLARCRAQVCEDDPLWLDGEALACKDSGLDCSVWFCPDCPYASTCDAHCGFCESIAAVPLSKASQCAAMGGILDCAGQCLKPADCVLSTLGYATCDRWLGNGCCDDGLGYVSDLGKSPHFNCPAFQCDGGDCDRCSNGDDDPEPASSAFEASEEPPPRDQWCLLLTSTICPAQGMTHTVRADPEIRRKDYVRAVSQWARGNGTALPIAVVENSGANLTALKAVVPANAQFDFVSFHDADIQPYRGKGHAEYGAILHAMRRSALLRGCSTIVKITGRYFIENIDAAIETLKLEGARVAVQSTPSPWVTWDGVLRSEVVAFANDPVLADDLFGNQDEAIGMPMERSIFVAVRELRNRGTRIGHFPALSVTPTINAEHTHMITIL